MIAKQQKINDIKQVRVHIRPHLAPNVGSFFNCITMQTGPCRYSDASIYTYIFLVFLHMMPMRWKGVTMIVGSISNSTSLLLVLGLAL